MKQEQVTVIELLPKIYHHINVAVRSATKEAIEQLLKDKTSKNTDNHGDFISAEQAASFLKLKLNTIYSKAEKGDLPFYRSGKRKLLFSKKELEQYVVKRKVKSLDEINEEVEAYKSKKK
ncbi:MAG: helix-turn-helix domain-containing protein [Bacteroidetes bacterium]|nr:helix-turn-helix domain-containing protein [Bacteroidota bacterium]